MVRQHRHIVRRFDDRERERLGKLFRQLGTDNIHESEAARGRIDSLLQQFSKSWSDLVSSLSGRTPTIHPALAADIAGLGDPDPDRRAGARRNLAELLARHRKTWNDLSDALCSITSAPWLNPSAAPDPERVNPLELLHYILQRFCRSSRLARIRHHRVVGPSHARLQPIHGDAALGAAQPNSRLR